MLAYILCKSIIHILKNLLKNKKRANLMINPFLYWRRDLNPHGYYYPLDFKSNVSTNSTTSALYRIVSSGAKDGIWTRDPHLGKVMLYPWATFALFKWTYTILVRMQIYNNLGKSKGNFKKRLYFSSLVNL